MMKWSVVIFGVVHFFGSYALHKQSLNGIWSLDESNGGYKRLKAAVPGGIFTDLQSNGIIDEPTLEENDQKTKWVGRTNWTYYRNFTVGKGFLSLSNVNIVFEGLDTISSIYLNGKRIGNSSNMFVRYIFNVKDELKVGTNVIEVKFLSPVKIAEELALEQSKLYSVPPDCPPSDYRGECHINQLRKMQASFSWDWGPALASMGIWKDVYLEAYKTSAIRYVVVEIEKNSVESIWNVSVRTYLAANSHGTVNGKLIYQLDTDESRITILKTINASVNDFGEVEFSDSFDIPQSSVRRWWPNGFGEQCLYNFNVTFVSGDEQHSHLQKLGFRNIELVQNKLNSTQGSIGNSFYFKVNGFPIFAKGSNAIPINILPERGQDKKGVDALLETARDCNMNMLRVWGGGVYESDYYYQRADELGLMIWQDFMFACALYPTRAEFLRNVLDEVRHQVRRIGSHPSIVTWAGNNENEAALTGNWYGSNGKQIYNDDYKKLYFKTIKPEFEKLLKRGTFIGSSPSNGVKSEEDGGISKNPYDLHYGDDHTYIYELDSFNPNIFPIPRFSSEYGFQSFPAPSTLNKSTTNASNLVIGSDFLKHRQHHSLGDLQIKLLTFYQLKLPSEDNSNYTNVYIFYNQIVQAMAIKTETEHYRKYRSIMTDDGTGLTMGALYWQLNDVWIAPTWSGIDVTGKWKMLQYYVSKAFDPIVILGHLNPDDSLTITVVSDKTTTFEDVTLTISVYNWTSFIPVNVTKHIITIESSSSKNILTIETVDYLQSVGCGGLSSASENCFFHLNLSKSNTSIAPDNYVFAKSLKSLIVQNPDIKVFSVEKMNQKDNRNFRITIKSSKIALFVWLHSEQVAGRFSDNGFHQINETKVIYFEAETDTTTENLEKSLSLSHMLDVNKF